MAAIVRLAIRSLFRIVGLRAVSGGGGHIADDLTSWGRLLDRRADLSVNVSAPQGFLEPANENQAALGCHGVDIGIEWLALFSATKTSNDGTERYTPSDLKSKD